MVGPSQRRTWVLGLIAFVIPLLIYMLWVPNNYTGDDLQQAMVIQQVTYGGLYYHPEGLVFYDPAVDMLGAPPSPMPVQPRYLLEYPTSILMSRLWRALGWNDSIITPVLTLRALVGALGTGLMFLTLYSLRRNALIALLASLGLATTAAYWTYSTHIDQSVNLMAAISLAMFLLVRMRNRRPGLRGMLILAAVVALATFYNFTAIFTVFAIGLGLALQTPGLRPIQRLRDFVLFNLFYGGMVASVMVLFIAIFRSPADLVSSTFWQAVLFAGKPEYGVDILRDAFRAILGLAKSQIFLPGVPGSLQAYWDTATQSQHLLTLAYFGIVLAILALPPLLLLIRRRKLTAGEGWLWVTLGAMFALHSVFNYFWDPGFIKYWLIPLYVLWFVAGIFLAHVRDSAERLYRPALIAAGAMLVATFAMNFATVFYPDSRPENVPWRSIALTLNQESQPTDLFIADGHPLDFYIAYFSRRNILSVDLISYANTNDSEDHLVSLVNSHIERHRNNGGQVYLFSAGDTGALAERLGIDPVKLDVAWTFPDLTIYRVIYDGAST